ncbi:hypothetical protein [Actinomadura gamaensis]|uniref:Uncharacterized protein n=1 Tax=Actinomadura gamaensis TaxID=1763541 RepID=A0ABV9UDX6_9ACTN
MTSNLDPNEVVTTHIADHLAALDENIRAADTPGNLDGLMARHVLRNATRLAPTYSTESVREQRIGEYGDGPVGAPLLAMLGYHLDELRADAAPSVKAAAVTGLQQLMRRDPFPLDDVTFHQDPRQLLGITLAIIAVADEVPGANRWLRQIIDDARFRSPTVRHELIRLHTYGVLTREPSVWVTDTGPQHPVDLAVLHWLVAQGTVRLPNPPEDLKIIQSGILKGLLSVPATGASAPDAAFLRAAAQQIIDTTIDESMLDRHHVGVVLRRFPKAMRRWRWDADPDIKNPIRWPITMEREVQDILWILLSTVFVDLVDEDPLRKFGHSSYRVDFGIPRLGVIVEIKYVRAAAEFKKIEKEVMEDYVAYLQDQSAYQKIVVFIYDESASIQEHAITEAALIRLEHVIDVVIVSRPSQLPPPAPKRRKATKTTRVAAAPPVTSKPNKSPTLDVEK